MDDLRRLQIDRLTAAIAPARYPAGATRLAVAYSGGPDSTALLHAMARNRHAVPIRALHVCHHLEADAQHWVAHCRAFARQQDIPFDCLHVHVDMRGQGMEAAAREARYAALARELEADEVLVLAQHAEDQAETFLVQALRGSGVDGLAAMPAQARFANGLIWRPFLALPRAILQAYIEQHALTTVIDPSNQDLQRARGFLRERIWPQLAEYWPQAAQTLSRSAHWCAEAAEVVAETARCDLARVQTSRGRLSVPQLQALSTFRQGNVLRQWLAEEGHDTPNRQHVAEIMRMCNAQLRGTPVVRWRRTEVRLFDGQLHAMPPVTRPATGWAAQWAMTDTLPLPDGCGRLHATFEGRPARSVTVCFRSGGERFRDDRLGGHRSLKKYLNEMRIPPWQRGRIPLLFLGNELVAVADLWRADGLAERLGIRNLQIEWQ